MYTYKIANFLGTGQRMGKRAKQRTKHAKAARLHAPKTSNRSHLLTTLNQGVSVRDLPLKGDRLDERRRGQRVGRCA